MQLVTWGLMGLPVVGLGYCLRDCWRTWENRQAAQPIDRLGVALADQPSAIETVAVATEPVLMSDFNPGLVHAAGETVHDLAIDFGEALDSVGHFLHH